MSANDAAIEIRGVWKSFGETRAVQNLDLVVPQNSLCGFLGPNGAGKSTTIRMIMSIIYPDAGSISVLGGSALTAKDRIGYLPEERGLYRKMRVGEFLHFIGRLKGLRGSQLRDRVDEWLRRVELANVARKRCHELSKGMQQKIQFLAAVIHDPDLIILDEPFSGLDPVNAALLKNLIDELRAGGKTIIFSTHVLHQAEQLCDRIFLINHGVKLLDATLEEIRRKFDPRTIIARPMSGEEPAFLPDGVVDAVCSGDRGTWELLLAEDADPSTIMREFILQEPVRSIELKELSLEEVFVRLVMKDEGEAAGRLVREELSHA